MKLAKTYHLLWIKKLISISAIFVTILISSVCLAAVSLQEISFKPMPENKLEIRMDFDGQPPIPQSYTIEEPARIALDLMDVENKLEKKHFSTGVDNAKSVTVLEAQGRTRAVINLAQLVDYDTRVEDSSLYVVLAENSSDQTPANKKEQPEKNTKSISQGELGPRVTNIDFQRSDRGEGQIVVTLSDPKIDVDMAEAKGKVRLEFSDVDLPKNLWRRLDVRDFATPVTSVRTFMQSDNTVLVIQAKGNYEHQVFQTDNTLTIKVTPVSAAEIARRESSRGPYKGEKLSLNFQSIQVRSVLQLIADFTDLNIVASDTVAGNITLRLKNVPWDHALDLILQTKGLDKRQIGNVILVAPAEEIAAREKFELSAAQEIAQLAPLRTEFIQINYADAQQLAAMFDTKSGVLSERGSAIVDARTNTILLTDTPEKLSTFKRLITRLDIPVRQVLIEARIVIARTNFSKELGVRWGGFYFEAGGSGLNSIGGSQQTLDDVQSSGGVPPINFSRPDQLLVDLGASSPNASSIAFGILRDSSLLELELSALETDGNGEVVAQPKVLTADQQTARIESGTEIPYQESTSSGATNVEFKDAVLALEVTPQITPDDKIIMQLKINQDTIGEIFNGVPSIDTNEVITQVLVENGETIVLGGIYRTETVNTITKTPFLGDIPYVGRLFKKTAKQDEKSELLIFITPKIVKDTLALR